MLTNSGDVAIAQGIISLPEGLGRSVIAEGVEAAAHTAKLLSMDCDIGQGYDITRPMPSAELPQWVKSKHENSIWQA